MAHAAPVRVLAALLAAGACAAARGQGAGGVLAGGSSLSPSMAAGRTVPLWQLEPFDRFQVKDEAKTWVDIEPQRLPEDFDLAGIKADEPVPEYGLPTALVFRRDIWYRFRAIVDAGRYEVRGDGIAKIELYEEAIYKELDAELSKDRTPDRIKFDDCLEYLRILREREPLNKLQKLVRTFKLAKFARVRYHAAEAAAASNRADFHRSFEALEEERKARLLLPADEKLPVELSELHPLETRADQCCDNWLRVTLGSGRFDEARRIIGRLEAAYPKAPCAERWRRDIGKQVRAVVERARQNEAAGFPTKAYDQLDQAASMQPDHPEMRAAFARLAGAHPRLRVAVAELPGYRLGPAAWTAADQRAAALLHEPLVRLAGFRPDGTSIFESRLLSAIKDEDDLNRKVLVEVKAGLRWPGDGKPVTPIDVQQLFALAREPASALHHPALELLLTNVQARPPAATLLEFDRPQFQARMWLQTPLFRLGVDPTANNSVAGLGWQGLGPFRAYDRSLDRVQYVANPRFLVPGQPALKVLTEIRHQRPEDRFRAVEYGDADLVDFVPWRHAAVAAKVPNARVVREALPKVHFLQFNYSRDLLRNYRVRLAIALALDRPAIFKAVGVEPGPDDRLLANAAPHGAVGDNPSVPLRLTDKVMAKVNLAAGLKELGAAKAPLALAYLGNESTRVAVDEIAKQLNAAGFEVTVVAVDDRNPDPRAADLRYQTVAATEAVYDLVTLLTRDNPTLFAYATPSLRKLLVELLQVSSSTKALALIPDIHKALHAEIALVPLWQWHDQFLVADSVQGLPAKPRAVYDGISGWRAEPRFPPSWWETRADGVAPGANR